LWDVGAGSGSVAIEASLLSPGLRVYAIERDPADAGRIESNASRLGVSITVVHGAAPAALTGLPDPDRVFVGGGGLAVLDAVMARLRPGGQVVATFAAIDRAAAAADRLGQLVQIAAGRGARLPDGGWRLAAENPVFVVWGPNP
jgi:precorrin-6Y C5,15-methyltransferase (decarboxylating)